MRTRYIPRFLLALALIFVNIGVIYAQDLDAGLKYQPPLIPISISLNARGKLTVRMEGRLQTPIGAFSVYGGAKGELFSAPGKTLTILHGSKRYTYRLQNRSFKVLLPPAETGVHSSLDYTSEGDIVVRIPATVEDTADSAIQ